MKLEEAYNLAEALTEERNGGKNLVLGENLEGCGNKCMWVPQ